MGLPSGGQLGRFRVVRRLGAGAMGEVYLAEDPAIERHVAIKTLKVDAGGDDANPEHRQFRLRLEREAKAAGKLVHPNIVTLFEVGESDGVLYLVFEYVDGTDLSARLRHGPSLTLSEIVRLGRETATALDAAHRVGIVHRDIKPSNLLLTADGGLKVADFGIATLVGQGTALTQSGAVVGTPQYLSPEQVRAEMVLDGRSDLFSLGVVLYELLEGRRPFDGGSVAALIYSIVAADPAPLGKLRPNLPPRLCAAVMRLLAKDRDKRFATAAELAAELAIVEKEMAAAADLSTEIRLQPLPSTLAPEQMATEALSSDLAPTAVSVTTPARRSRVVLWLFLPIALLAGATAGVVYLMPWPDGVKKDGGIVAGTESSRGSAPLPVGEKSGETNRVATSTHPGAAATTVEVIENDERAGETMRSEPAVAVGDVVTFRVTPPDASAKAIVKIDGLVRGLASGSVMTLRPGRHEVEVTAEGYAPRAFTVEATSGGTGTTEVPVAMAPR